MHNHPTLLRNIAFPSLGRLAVPKTRAVVSGLFLFTIAVVLFWATLLPAQAMSVDVGTDGSRDVGYLDGHYTREWVDSRTYRWLSGDAQIRLPGGRSGNTIFIGEWHSAPGPPGGALPVMLRANEIEVALAVPEAERTYRILFPPAALSGGELRIALSSSTIVPPGDSRALSIAVDRIGIKQIAGEYNAAFQLILAETLLLGAMVSLFWLNGLRGPALLAIGIGGVALLSGL
ncbi:hypothetical protein HC891_03655 [Candidatus Gracilibacteria bacterium]|nr:hypothetical protein [Candidatus Gracilibacteria bacterium]